MNNICKFPCLTFFCLRTAGLLPPSSWEEVASVLRDSPGPLSLTLHREMLIRYDDPAMIPAHRATHKTFLKQVAQNFRAGAQLRTTSPLFFLLPDKWMEAMWLLAERLWYRV